MRDICDGDSRWMIPLSNVNSSLPNRIPENVIADNYIKCLENNEELKQGLAFAVAIDDYEACHRFMNFRMSDVIRDRALLSGSGLYLLYRDNVILSLTKNGSNAKVFNYLIKEDPWKCKNYYMPEKRHIIMGSLGPIGSIGPIMSDIRTEIQENYKIKRYNIKMKTTEGDKRDRTIYQSVDWEEKNLIESALEICQNNGCKTIDTIQKEEKRITKKEESKNLLQMFRILLRVCVIYFKKLLFLGYFSPGW